MSRSPWLRLHRLVPLVTLSCGVQGGDQATRHLVLHPCVSWATREMARCGTMRVPERRDRPGTRMVQLQVMLLPARGPVVMPDPLVFFNGGPGISTVAYADYASQAFGTLRDARDVILVDMRGTGRGNALPCNLYEDGGRIAPYLGRMFPLTAVRECATRLSAKADLAQYTTDAAAQDFEDVRTALELPQVNLFGASYGSRLALAYMRLYPAHVRRAVLLGVLPPEAPIGRDFRRGTAQALDSAFAACAASTSCAVQVPDPRRDVSVLLHALHQKPATIRIWNWHRLSRERITLTSEAVAELLWVESYSPGGLLDVLPLVHLAARGDMVLLADHLARSSRARRAGRNEGLMLSVICSEDAGRLSEHDAEDAGTLLGAPEVEDIVHACAAWPRGAVSPHFADRVVSSIPTLLMSGGRDPVTPSYLADSAATALSASERYLDPQAGHASLDDRGRARLAAFLQ